MRKNGNDLSVEVLVFEVGHSGDSLAALEYQVQSRGCSKVTCLRD